MVRGDSLKLLQRPRSDPRHAAVGLVVRQAEQAADVRRVPVPRETRPVEQRPDAGGGK